MTPSKEELEAKAKHFANTVFVIGAGVIMLAAKRASFALFAIERQCAKYGHVPREGSSVCSRCFQTIADEPRTD